jgi:hypothetical protein
LQVFDVRAEFSNRPWTGILIPMTAYFAAYLFAPLFSGKYNRILNFSSLTGISILGSLMLSLYILSHTIIEGSINSSASAASQYYVPALKVFLTSLAIFFLSSAITLNVPPLIIKSRENAFR